METVNQKRRANPLDATISLLGLDFPQVTGDLRGEAPGVRSELQAAHDCLRGLNSLLLLARNNESLRECHNDNDTVSVPPLTTNTLDALYALGQVASVAVADSIDRLLSRASINL